MTGGAELQQGETLAGDLPEELREKARRTVASHAIDAREARGLLEMLGLVDAVAEPREVCGTWRGRGRHVQLDEPVCGPCVDAYTAYLAERREAKRVADEKRRVAAERQRRLAVSAVSPKSGACAADARRIAARLDDCWGGAS